VQCACVAVPPLVLAISDHWFRTSVGLHSFRRVNAAVFIVFNLALRAACKLSGKLCCDPLAQFRCLFPLVRRSREELGTLFLNHSKTKKNL